MRNLSTQLVILLSVIAICLSSIAIAFITDDDCQARMGPPQMMMHRPPPPEGMFGNGPGRDEGRRGREQGAFQRGRRGGQLKNSSRPERRPQ